MARALESIIFFSKTIFCSMIFFWRGSCFAQRRGRVFKIWRSAGNFHVVRKDDARSLSEKPQCHVFVETLTRRDEQITSRQFISAISLPRKRRGVVGRSEILQARGEHVSLRGGSEAAGEGAATGRWPALCVVVVARARCQTSVACLVAVARGRVPTVACWAGTQS